MKGFVVSPDILKLLNNFQRLWIPTIAGMAIRMTFPLFWINDVIDSDDDMTHCTRAVSPSFVGSRFGNDKRLIAVYLFTWKVRKLMI